MTTKELVLKYFHSWQEPADYDELGSCLAPDLTIDSGFFRFSDRASFLEFLKQNHTPWKDIAMISSFFKDDEAAILYEGVNSETGRKMRVSEHLRLSDGEISEIQTVISQLN